MHAGTAHRWGTAPGPWFKQCIGVLRPLGPDRSAEGITRAGSSIRTARAQRPMRPLSPGTPTPSLLRFSEQSVQPKRLVGVRQAVHWATGAPYARGGCRSSSSWRECPPSWPNERMGQCCRPSQCLFIVCATDPRVVLNRRYRPHTFWDGTTGSPDPRGALGWWGVFELDPPQRAMIRHVRKVSCGQEMLALCTSESNLEMMSSGSELTSWLVNQSSQNR